MTHEATATVWRVGMDHGPKPINIKAQTPREAAEMWGGGRVELDSALMSPEPGQPGWKSVAVHRVLAAGQFAFAEQYRLVYRCGFTGPTIETEAEFEERNHQEVAAVTPAEVCALYAAAIAAFGQKHLPPSQRSHPEAVDRALAAAPFISRPAFLSAAAALPDPAPVLLEYARARERENAPDRETEGNER